MLHSLIKRYIKSISKKTTKTLFHEIQSFLLLISHCWYFVLIFIKKLIITKKSQSEIEFLRVKQQ